MRVFGCACYHNLRLYTTNKFDPKSLLCVFLGYTEKQKGYRCLYPPTGRVYISRHVLFDETKFPFSDVYQSLLPQAITPLLSAWYKGLHICSEEEAEPTPEVPVEPVIRGTRLQPVAPVASPQLQHDNNAEFILNNDDFPPLSPPVQAAVIPPQAQQAPVVVPVAQVQQQDSSHTMVTRSKTGVRKPNPRYVLHTVKSEVTKPRNLAEALSHPGWNGAMTDEVGTCHETNTWSLVPYPSGAHVLGCGWVHKIKLNADGTVEKLRSRLVARGNEQEEGVDFLETYSPVVCTATVRMVLHTATVHHWDIKQLDVKNAFLHGDLTETVYMKQPPGFEDPTRP